MFLTAVLVMIHCLVADMIDLNHFFRYRMCRAFQVIDPNAGECEAIYYIILEVYAGAKINLLFKSVKRPIIFIDVNIGRALKRL